MTPTRLRSFNFRRQYIRHRDFEGELNELNGHATRADFAWRLERVGHEAGVELVRFRSVNVPDHVLRHQGFRVVLEKVRDEERFRKDSTFRALPSLVETDEDRWQSFEPLNLPGYYLSHIDFRLYVRKDDGSQSFLEDATFRREPTR